MRNMKRWLVLLLALAMVAAACSQGGDDGESGDTTEGTEAPTESTEAPTESTEAPTETTEGGDGDMMDVLTDGVTATEDVINVGILADLSGPFATLVKDIVDSEVYFFEDYVEQTGGIGGHWDVNVIIEDTGYDVTVHGEKYQELKSQVVAFTQSTGSPHTASIAQLLVEDNLIAIPLSWYSGWADPAIGGNVFEQGATYCVDGMNTLEYAAEKFETDNGRLPTVGIASFPGDYGQDGAVGAKLAAADLGLEVVYDGEALVGREGNTEVIQGLVDAAPDVVWTAVTPGALAEIFGGTTQQGLSEALWVGLNPSFNLALLDTPLGPEFLRRYTHVGAYAPYGADVEGMDELERVMVEKDPDRQMTDAFSRGWIEFEIMRNILELAVEMGDLTPAGVTAAAQALGTLDFGEISSPQTWSGDPNDNIVRGSNIFALNPDYAPSTVAEGTAEVFIVEAPNWVGDTAAAWEFEPCYTPEG